MLVPAGAAYQASPARITPISSQVDATPVQLHGPGEGRLATALAARVVAGEREGRWADEEDGWTRG